MRRRPASDWTVKIAPMRAPCVGSPDRLQGMSGVAMIAGITGQDGSGVAGIGGSGRAAGGSDRPVGGRGDRVAINQIMLILKSHSILELASRDGFEENCKL
ncbi:hypothetical protein Pta02_05850 [Planobispora takensis]|uniref:Uncharacterized protein n=1 Tax=Planobispora takensis TaxID=1367882 RepID=A0A8J3SQ90_9ACTN|nr:hypothetical protein Pta02_05850 [Planobispora takensis]